ncbi:hypothetical protein F5Y06DRAFT_203491 [Hypoxylon sp. FL0890]|nr:hypothetical protein F5Y06DRAFT_203491 [Hypoxylon sp. FL0890]
MKLWEDISGAITWAIVQLWAATFGTILAETGEVDAEDIGIVWTLIERYLRAFALGIEERFPQLIIFTINLEEVWRTDVGPALSEKAVKMTYRGFANLLDDLITSLRHYFFLVQRLVFRALDQEVRRVAPFIFHVAAFILSVCCWALWLYFIFYSDRLFEPKPDITLQPKPLTWQEQDNISPYFQKAVLENRLRWRHRVDGDVVKLHHWYLN